MKTVREVSQICGVSVRTLHHYDSIGLLRPTEHTQSGYRLYDDNAIARLQSILLFRELRFPLSQIQQILDAPDFDPMQAIDDQIALLLLEKKRLDELISLARKIRKNGGYTMTFNAFDTSEIEQYKEEAKTRWGETAAWQQARKRQNSGKNFAAAGSEMMALFAEIGKIRHLSPEDTAVQEKIDALRRFITDNFYDCTIEILRGLGAMYVSDERFRANIDAAGGPGTAEFSAKAIEIYCSAQ